MKKLRVFGVPLALWVVLLPLFALADIPKEPMQAFFVNDFADVISKEDEAEMLELGQAVQDQSEAQVVAVTVNFLDGMESEEYAAQLFNKWELGQKGKNNGVLLLLSIGDREIWTTVGEGLEKKLSPAITGQYTDDYAIPYLKVDDYSTGMLENYRALCEKVASIYGFSLSASQGQNQAGTDQGDNTSYYGDNWSNSWGGGSSIVGLFMGFAVLMIILSIIRSVFRATGNATGCLFGWMLGRSTSRHNRWHRTPPPPFMGGGPRHRPPGGRSTGSFGGGGFGGFGGGGRSGGGGRVGGGGSTRGGGSGRKF